MTAGTRNFKGAAYFVSDGSNQPLGVATTYRHKDGHYHGSYFRIDIRGLNNVVQIVETADHVGGFR